MTQLTKIVRILTLLSIVSVLVSIAASESFLAMAFLAWLPIGIAESRQLKRLAVEWPPFFWPIQLFVLATILSFLLSPDPHAGFSVIKKLPLYFLCFLVIRFFDWDWTKRTFMTLFALGSVAGIVAAVQFIIKWEHFQRTGNPADNPTLVFRVQGFMGHWMTFSGQQVLIMSALLAFLACYPLRKRWAWSVATLAIASSILLSFTRSVWLATVAVFLLVVIKSRKTILWAIPLGLLLLALVFPHAVQERLQSFLDKGFSSNQGRVEMARAGWEMFKAHPWFGVGPQMVQGEFEAILQKEGWVNPPFYTGHLHNNLIQIAVERGVFALLAFVWLIVELVVRFWRGSRIGAFPGEVRAVYLAGLLATIALVVAGLFEYNFVHSPVTILFLFLISAPYAASVKTATASRSAVIS
jgi:O-antigen ligase